MFRLFLISLFCLFVTTLSAKESDTVGQEKPQTISSTNTLGTATWRNIPRLESKISLPDRENEIKNNRAFIALDDSGIYAEIIAFSNGSILYKQDKDFFDASIAKSYKKREQELIKILSIEKRLKRLDITKLFNFKHELIQDKESKQMYALSTAVASSRKAYCYIFKKYLLPRGNALYAKRARGVFCFPKKSESSFNLVSDIEKKLIFDDGHYAQRYSLRGVTKKVHDYWSRIEQNPPVIKLSRAEFSNSGIIVSGNVSDASPIGFIKVAGERLSNNDLHHVLKSNGDFNIYIKSQRTISKASISIGDKYGNASEKIITKKVTSLSSNQSPIIFKAPSSGKTYALLVGVSKYKLKGLTKLISPPYDVRLIGGTLKSTVGIPNNQIITLKNPSKKEFIKTLNDLRENKLTFGDQLLVYFSGHGSVYKDPRSGKKFGYWLFSDTTEKPQSWLSNKEINNIFSGFSDGGVMLIADSCFSGNFISKYFNSLDEVDLTKSEESKTVLTAAGDSPTPDNNEKLNSSFALAVNNTLKFWTRNVKRSGKSTIPGSVIFLTARENLKNKGLKIPQYGSFHLATSGIRKPKDFLLIIGR